MKKIKDFTTTTASGEVLDFGDQLKVNTPEEIVVGMTATISDPENPALSTIPDGDYVMPDGGIFVFAAGTLIEMKEPEQVEGTETMIKAIRMKGKLFVWNQGKYMKGIQYKGKLYVADAKGKFNVLVKDDQEKRMSRSPGKPISGI